MGFIFCAFHTQKSNKMKNTSNDLTFTILYDNYIYNNELENDWGFSCLIEGLDQTILFDTGGKGNILLSNMKKMGKEPGDVDIVFISHIHQDHTGGLSDILDLNPHIRVFMPVSFPEYFKKMVKSKGAESTEITGPLEIINGVKSTGEKAIKIFKEKYRNDFIGLGVGKVFKLSEL
jgi:7,8-dihydropterin-6-yl-methyl-4-(beta-D-ribofuranosyl)aminobenzene 5'-phosphate synthase